MLCLAISVPLLDHANAFQAIRHSKKGYSSPIHQEIAQYEGISMGDRAQQGTQTTR